MPDELKRSQLRAIQYYYVDGSFEFGFGLLSLIMSVYFYVDAHVQVQSWLSALVEASLVLVIIGGGYLIKALVRKLKERVTWPRTGYVAYEKKQGPKQGWRILLGMVIGGLVAALTAVLVTIPHPGLALMPAFSGILMGIVLAVIAWRTAIVRFYLLALLSASVGVALAFSGLENIPGLIVFYAALALVLFLAGACVLRSYLHQNPAPQDGVQ